MKPTRPLRRRSRHAAPIFLLVAAGVAGWFSVSPMEGQLPPETSRQAVAGRDRAPGAAVSAAAADPAALAASHSKTAVSARLERELLHALDPDSRQYSGERLAQLCLADNAEDLPGGNPAFTYAWLWAKAAPAEMYAWFRSRGSGGFNLPAGNSNYDFGNAIFSEWAKRDPERAITAALEGGTPGLRRSSLVEVINVLRMTDPARAAELAARNLALLAPPAATGSPFSAYGEEYQATWEFLTALPSTKERGALLAPFFTDLVRYHPVESGELWRNLSTASRQELVAGGFQSLDSEPFDFSPAQSWLGPDSLEELRRQQLAASGDAEGMRNYLRIEAVEWAERDPAAAIAWSREHATGEAQVTGTAFLFRAGAAKNFDTTLAIWQSLPDGSLRARAAGQLAVGAPEDRKAEAETLVSSLAPADQTTARRAMRQTSGGFRLSSP